MTVDDGNIDGYVDLFIFEKSLSDEVYKLSIYEKIIASSEDDTNELSQINNGDFIDDLNPESLSVIKKAKLEASLSTASTKTIYQFERTGYFIIDSKDSSFDNLIFNRAVSLRDSWARLNR